MSRRILTDFKRPLIFAHRGFSAKAPENTMASFEMAINAGSPGIELDVHLSKDGQVVVFHDKNLQRLGDRPESLHNQAYSFLKTVDIGSWHSSHYGNERIPLLTEVLEMAKGRVYFDIEIKHTDVHPHPIEPLIVKILKDFKMEQQCIVSSFNPFAIRHIKKFDHALSRAVIFADFPDIPPVLRRGLGRWIAGFPQILKPNWRLLTGSHPMRFSPLFRVIPWTINDPIIAARMLAYKVEGMIGDDPTLLMNAVL